MSHIITNWENDLIDEKNNVNSQNQNNYNNNLNADMLNNYFNNTVINSYNHNFKKPPKNMDVVKSISEKSTKHKNNESKKI